MNLVELHYVCLIPWEGQVNGAHWAVEEAGVLPSPQGRGHGCMANCQMLIPMGDLRSPLMARAACEAEM